MSQPIKSKYHAIVRLMDIDRPRVVAEQAAVHIAARLFPGKGDDHDFEVQKQRIADEAEMVRVGIAYHTEQCDELRAHLSALQMLAFYEMDIDFDEAAALVREPREAAS